MKKLCLDINIFYSCVEISEISLFRGRRARPSRGKQELRGECFVFLFNLSVELSYEAYRATAWPCSASSHYRITFYRTTCPISSANWFSLDFSQRKFLRGLCA